MDIELHRITVREVVDGYEDRGVKGVMGYGGRLDIRPKYQREFVYDDDQRQEVIRTVKKNFPLNVMYWMVKDDKQKTEFEMLDGQQRTISIGQYVTGDFSLDNRYFHNLTQEEKEQILDYELMIYFCEGTDKERLEWFRVINIAGEQLTEQEIRNAVYTGPWLSDAKLKFSKPRCAAYGLATDGGKLLRGSPIRQEYLETAIKWINDGEVAAYMAEHQHDDNADELWNYFQDVIAWVRETFPNYRKEMKRVNWGELYNEYKEDDLDPQELEKEVSSLMENDEVTKKSGIYPYVLNRKEKHLNIRSFSNKMKREAYEREGGICAECGEHFDIDEMEADHITPWHEGGRTIRENCQLLCKEHNRKKSGK